MQQLCPVQNLNFRHNLQESPSAKTFYTGGSTMLHILQHYKFNS